MICDGSSHLNVHAILNRKKKENTIADKTTPTIRLERHTQKRHSIFAFYRIADF